MVLFVEPVNCKYFWVVTLTESQRMMKNTNTCKVKGWCQEYFLFILELN